MIWIGLDEAGYGPLLGPLAVGATVWRVPDETPPRCLYELLAGVVSAQANRNGDSPPGVKSKRTHHDGVATLTPTTTSLWIADSKVVYQSGEIADLERGVHALVQLAHAQHCVRAEELLRIVVRRQATDLPAWHWDPDYGLPCDDTAHSDRAAFHGTDFQQNFRDAIHARNCDLLTVRAALLWPGEFNRELAARENNKSLVLFHLGFELLQSLIAEYPDEPIWIDADKLGGRDYYGGLLQQSLGGAWVEVLHEASEESLYRWSDGRGRDAGPPRWIRYRVCGERAVPTAAASMTAKYLREISMRIWNRFWREQLPDLRPTAGYHVDGTRFVKEIARRQKALRIPACEIIRNK